MGHPLLHSKLQSVVYGTGSVGSEELVDVGKGLCAYVESALGCIRSHASERADDGRPGDVFGAWAKVKFGVGGILEQVGVEADPIVVNPRVDIIGRDLGVKREFTLHPR